MLEIQVIWLTPSCQDKFDLSIDTWNIELEFEKVVGQCDLSFICLGTLYTEKGFWYQAFFQFYFRRAVLPGFARGVQFFKIIWCMDNE